LAGLVPYPHMPITSLVRGERGAAIGNLNRKVRDYLLAGSQEVWLLDPENGELHVRTKTGIRLLQGKDKLGVCRG